MANRIRSVVPIVRMLPNKNDDNSGTYPGVRNMKMVPNAMPNAHTTPMAESSRTLPLRASHSTPRAETMANTPAVRAGLKPA